MAALSKYKTYPEYKDSYSKWYSEIPNHWDRVPLKYITLNFVKDGPHETPKFIGSGIPFLSVDGIQNNSLIFDNCRYISKDDHMRYSLKCKPAFGDILLGKAASVGKVALVNTNIEFNVWSPLAVITPKNSNFSKYIYYSLQSTNLQTQCDLYSNSNTQKNLGMSTIDNLHFLQPSDHEANTIAQFLDHETTKIDQLIEKQQTLIALLKEKRQAVISHAVTKGLDPNAKMKDSGVEWLGEVPEHWEVKPLKYICTFSGGGTPSKDNLSFWSNGDIPWVSPKDMKHKYIHSTMDYITELAVKESSTKLVNPDTLLIVVRSGILQRTIPLAINKVQVTINQDMKALTFNQNKINVEFIYYCITGNTPKLLLEWSKEGATVESIEHEYLSNTEFPYPSYHEQQDIINFLDNQTSKFELLVQKAEQQIELMKERRTALISAAVTGKIDVRDWQPEQR